MKPLTTTCSFGWMVTRLCSADLTTAIRLQCRENCFSRREMQRRARYHDDRCEMVCKHLGPSCLPQVSTRKTRSWCQAVWGCSAVVCPRHYQQKTWLQGALADPWNGDVCLDVPQIWQRLAIITFNLKQLIYLMQV